MKRLCLVWLFILFLSFPALGGHNVPGGFYCECDNPESHLSLTTQEDEISWDTNQASAPETDFGLLLQVLLLLVRV